MVSGIRDFEALNRRLTASRWDDSALNQQVRRAARDAGQVFFDREKLVCPEETCDLTWDYGEVALFDSGHWTLYGANMFASRLEESGTMDQFFRRVTEYAKETPIVDR